MIIASATTFRNVSTCSDGSHGPHLHLFKAAVDIIKAVKPEITSSAGLNNSQLDTMSGQTPNLREKSRG